MRHFDVQLIGGIILHQGRIAEMRTGEGKTLVATLPAYLNALTGKGVHVITVNDYLAKRDSEWMGKLYKFLGLSVGLVISRMSPEQKQKAYACDITYEVFAPGISKAAAVKRLAHDCAADRVVVFGDNLNDLSMMEIADVSVAVGNALPEVKRRADVVIGRNDEDAVARFIEEDFNSHR